MTRRPIRLLVLVALLASASPCPAAGLSGQLQGILELKAAPPVPWRVELAEGATFSSLPLTLTADADGLELRVALEQKAGGEILWRIENASIDLVEWWPAIRALTGLDETLAGWRTGGRVRVTGAGSVIGGRPAGRVHVAVEDALAVHEADGIEIRGIQASFDCEDLGGFSLQPGQRIDVGLIRAAGITASDATIRLGRSADGVIDLRQVTAKVFDGSVSLEPFLFNPARPLLKLKLRFDRLSVPLMAALVPDALSAAQGRLSGTGSISWRLERAVPDEVFLTFANPGAASLSLSPQPGLLSAGVPPRFVLLPVNLGPLTKLFAPENPAYKPLVAIELGRLPLRIDELQMMFTPKGAGGTNRSAWLHLKGRPEDNRLIKSVTIDLNIHGSLSEVISLGMDKRLR